MTIDAPMSSLANWKNRLVGQGGMTLIELIVAMSILLVVLGAIVGSFASATKTEFDQVARADAQQNARQALETLRRDIHCATAADPTTTAGTLTLTQPAAPVSCALPTTPIASVAWCTTGSAGRYQLRRATSGSCSSSSLLKADYLTTSAPWSNGTCVRGRARTVAIDLIVSVQGKSLGAKTYELRDAIVLRNGSLCP